jgi:hypothetical protein
VHSSMCFYTGVRCKLIILWLLRHIRTVLKYSTFLVAAATFIYHTGANRNRAVTSQHGDGRLRRNISARNL